MTGLADLLDDGSDPVVEPTQTPIKEGDGTAVPNLVEEANKTEITEPPAPTPEDEGEGNEDGKPEGQEDDNKGDEDTEALDPTQFFSTLDSLYGEDINSQIDYGDVDPLSPEGVYKREQYMLTRGAAQFENFLKESDPRAYAYFLHRKNGGDDTEFYSKPTSVLPDLQALKDSVDLQRKVYQKSLEAKGNSEKQIQALLKLSADSGELSNDAEDAWKELKEREEKGLKDAETAHAKRLETEQRNFTEMDNVINSAISSPNSLKFIIPDSDKAGFVQQFKSQIHYEDGEFFLLKPLTKDNLSQNMEAELFNYLKGDLKKLVERKATTLSSSRIIKKAQQKNGTPKSSESSTGPTTLGSILS